MLRGILHIHSIFSDGEETLERLAESLKASGIQFMAVSDHAEVFDSEKMARYVQLCAALSTEEFLVIPGLEYASPGGLHILGFGVTERTRAKDADGIVDGIHQAGGLAVLAHPPAGSINLITSVKHKLDGIEVWNGRYDGVHAPRPDSFQLLRRIRRINSRASAFGGVDLHKKDQLCKLITVDVAAHRLDRVLILDALRAGQFRIRCGGLAIPASGDLTFVQQISIAVKQPLSRPRAS